MVHVSPPSRHAVPFCRCVPWWCVCACESCPAEGLYVDFMRCRNRKPCYCLLALISLPACWNTPHAPNGREPRMRRTARYSSSSRPPPEPPTPEPGGTPAHAPALAGPTPPTRQQRLARHVTRTHLAWLVAALVVCLLAMAVCTQQRTTQCQLTQEDIDAAVLHTLINKTMPSPPPVPCAGGTVGGACGGAQQGQTSAKGRPACRARRTKPTRTTKPLQKTVKSKPAWAPVW